MLRSRINNIPRLDFPDRRSDLEACNSGETEKANSTALFFQDLAIFVKILKIYSKIAQIPVILGANQ